MNGDEGNVNRAMFKTAVLILLAAAALTVKPAAAQGAVYEPTMNIALWIASAFAIMLAVFTVLGAFTSGGVDEDDVLLTFVLIVCIVIAAVAFNVYFSGP